MTVEWSFVLQRGVLPLASGFVLGLAYFTGLWWTSRRVARVVRPGLFFLGSFALRMAALLGGIWLVTKGQPVETALAMAGLLLGRRLVFVRVAPRGAAPDRAAGGNG